MRMNEKLIRDNAIIVTFKAMRSQSRPSVDSRSSIESPDANEYSPLVRCHRGADKTTQMS